MLYCCHIRSLWLSPPKKQIRLKMQYCCNIPSLTLSPPENQIRSKCSIAAISPLSNKNQIRLNMDYCCHIPSLHLSPHKEPYKIKIQYCQNIPLSSISLPENTIRSKCSIATTSPLSPSLPTSPKNQIRLNMEYSSLALSIQEMISCRGFAMIRLFYFDWHHDIFYFSMPPFRTWVRLGFPTISCPLKHFVIFFNLS